MIAATRWGDRILGVGCDLCAIARIRDWHARFHPRRTGELFTPHEQAQAQGATDPVIAYALRFAAKEACAKALGSGFSAGVRWTDLEVLGAEAGAPRVRLSGQALERLQSLAPLAEDIVIDLSLSHSPELAQAIVVASASSRRRSGG